MTKLFCDMCGEEIDQKNKENLSLKAYLPIETPEGVENIMVHCCKDICNECALKIKLFVEKGKTAHS